MFNHKCKKITPPDIVIGFPAQISKRGSQTVLLIVLEQVTIPFLLEILIELCNDLGRLW